MAIVFVAHLWHAASVYFNPDEALHYQLAHQRSAAEAYVANNTNAHPPLLIMSLYVLTHVGKSELFLRLLPVLCSVALIGFAYLWGARLSGPELGLTLAILLAFLPPVWDLATEVRHYSLALCFACASLYFLERGIDERSPKWMGISAVMLLFAILSNYSVLWFTAAYGVYSLWRVWKAALPRPATAVWATGQATALAVYGALYVTHISRISGTDMSKEARQGWLSSYYCTSDLIPCLAYNTLGVFEYMSGQLALSAFAILLFLGGLVVLWYRKRSLLLLIAVQFLACWAGVSAGLYPYGGSRHSVLFALPVALSLSFVFVGLARGKARVSAGIAAALAGIWMLFSTSDMQSHKMPTHARDFAAQSVAYLNQRVPKGGVVFTDHQAMLLLCYYANRDGYCKDDSNRHFWHYQMNGYHVVTSKKWSLEPDEFVEELRALKDELHLGKGAEVWLFDGGWGVPLSKSLPYRFGGTLLPGLREFGEHLAVFRIPN